jgi:hypothetical protein
MAADALVGNAFGKLFHQVIRFPSRQFVDTDNFVALDRPSLAPVVFLTLDDR